jgi:hypothetical protein
MEEFNKFIGENYSAVNEQITVLANKKGITSVYPWPEHIGGYADDEDTLVVFINNDIEQKIVKFK